MKQYQDGAVELVATADAAITLTLEAGANRFLRNKVKPSGRASQRRYLQLIEAHSEALTQLLAGYQEMDGTIADPFAFLKRSPSSGATIDHGLSIGAVRRKRF